MTRFLSMLPHCTTPIPEEMLKFFSSLISNHADAEVSTIILPSIKLYLFHVHSFAPLPTWINSGSFEDFSTELQDHINTSFILQSLPPVAMDKFKPSHLGLFAHALFRFITGDFSFVPYADKYLPNYLHLLHLFTIEGNLDRLFTAKGLPTHELRQHAELNIELDEMMPKQGLLSHLRTFPPSYSRITFHSNGSPTTTMSLMNLKDKICHSLSMFDFPDDDRTQQLSSLLESNPDIKSAEELSSHKFKLIRLLAPFIHKLNDNGSELLAHEVRNLKSYRKTLRQISFNASPQETLDVRVRPWDRTPYSDFFLGNDTSCCLSTQGIGFPHMLGYFLDAGVFINYIETKQPCSKEWKLSGLDCLYIGKPRVGKQVFLVSNFQIISPDSRSPEFLRFLLHRELIDYGLLMTSGTPLNYICSDFNHTTKTLSTCSQSFLHIICLKKLLQLFPNLDLKIPYFMFT